MKTMQMITLEDNSKYALLFDITYNKTKYFIAIEWDEYDYPTDNYVILKEINVNGEIYVDEEHDKELCSKLMDKYILKAKLLIEEIKKQTNS